MLKTAGSTRLLRLAAGLCALLIAGAAQPAAAKDWTNIRIATEGAFPPYNFTKPDGTLGGFEIDLAHDLCRRIKAKCEIVAQDWDGILPGLTGGKYDAIMAGMSITPKRQEVIAFSLPYINSPTQLATSKGGGLEKLPGTGGRFNLSTDEAAARAAIDAMKGPLKGKVIGVQVSTIQADFANTYLKGVVDVRTYKTSDEILLDLTAGRVDAALASAAVLQAAIDKPDGQDIVFTGPGFTGGIIGVGSAIGIRKTDPDLVALFNGAIKEAVADGSLAKLSVQWFKLDLTPR